MRKSMNNQDRDNAFKDMVIRNQISFIKEGYPSVEAKVADLHRLTHDLYRRGTKYRYNCNLTNAQIRFIILSANDDALYQAYFGKTIAEAKEDGLTLFWCIVFAYIMLHVWIVYKLFFY